VSILLPCDQRFNVAGRHYTRLDAKIICLFVLTDFSDTVRTRMQKWQKPLVTTITNGFCFNGAAGRNRIHYPFVSSPKSATAYSY
jgi:hypothetical protein